MNVKDCFDDGLVEGSKILLYGREHMLNDVTHIGDNVYSVTVETGIEGEEAYECKVSAEHEVLVPSGTKVRINITKEEVDAMTDKIPDFEIDVAAESKADKSKKKDPDEAEAVALSAADFDDNVEPPSKSEPKAKAKGKSK